MLTHVQRKSHSRLSLCLSKTVKKLFVGTFWFACKFTITCVHLHNFVYLFKREAVHLKGMYDSNTPEPKVEVNGLVDSLKYNELDGGERGSFRPPNNLTQSGERHVFTTTVVRRILRGKFNADPIEISFGHVTLLCISCVLTFKHPRYKHEPV